MPAHAGGVALCEYPRRMTRRRKAQLQLPRLIPAARRNTGVASRLLGLGATLGAIEQGSEVRFARMRRQTNEN